VSDTSDKLTEPEGSITIWLKNISNHNLNVYKVKTSLTYEDGGQKYFSYIKLMTIRDTTSKWLREIEIKSMKPLPKQLPLQRSIYHFNLEFRQPVPKTIKYITKIDSVEYSSNGQFQQFVKTTMLKRKTILIPWLFRND